MNPDHYTTNQTFYDRISHLYDSIADKDEHVAREAGERALAIVPGEQVLELGVGTGNSLLHFAETVGESGGVAGIDVSPGMQEVARKKLDERGLTSRVDLRIGDARELPFDDGTFDAVFTSFTLELFEAEDIPIVLSEVLRVLKNSGRFGCVAMATVPPRENASLLEKTYVWMHRHFPHIVDCRPIDVASVIRSAGLSIEVEEEMKIWTMPVRVVTAVKNKDR